MCAEKKKNNENMKEWKNKIWNISGHKICQRCASIKKIKIKKGKQIDTSFSNESKSWLQCEKREEEKWPCSSNNCVIRTYAAKMLYEAIQIDIQIYLSIYTLHIWRASYSPFRQYSVDCAHTHTQHTVHTFSLSSQCAAPTTAAQAAV